MFINEAMYNSSVYSVVLRILHVTCSIVDFIFDVSLALTRKISFFSKYIQAESHEKSHLQRLEKLPVHLTVLLGTEEPSCKDLANLVLWSLATGIPFISFYDKQGILKKSEDELKAAVEKLRAEKCHIIWHSNESLRYKNGYTGRKIHVKVYSEADGRKCMAQRTKKLATVRCNDITIDTVDKYLSISYEFPDPDMGIYCGKTFSLYGYPPWQIRITEFFNLKTHHNLIYNNFIDLIYRYSKCERRLGK